MGIIYKMSYDIIKSLSGDFPDGLDPEQLMIDISNSGIMVFLNGVTNYDNDDVILTFSEEPTSGDLIIIDQVVAEHLPKNIVFDSYTLYPRVQKFSQSVYTLVGKIPFKRKWNIINIKCSSSMSSSATNYSVKVYDPVSTLDIAEGTFTNTGIPTTQNLGTILNTPSVTGDIEVQAKITSAEARPEGIIESITLFYRI